MKRAIVVTFVAMFRGAVLLSIFFFSQTFAAVTMPPLATGKQGMVVTCAPLAAQIGISVLKKGGTAADAFIATTLAEYVTAYGFTSLSGPLYFLYYDSKNKTSSYLNAGLNKVSDPTGQFDQNPNPGTSYVIGGAALGLEAIHRKFHKGKLSFADLVAPAAQLAQNGFAISSLYSYEINARSQLPGFANAQIWKNLYMPKGQVLPGGAVLKQSAFAQTLKRYGKLGAAYIYHGQFAQDLVSTLQAQGAKLTLDDLAKYQVQWSQPLETKYRDFTIQTSSYRSFGGTELLLDLKTIEQSPSLGNGPHFSLDQKTFDKVVRTFSLAHEAMLPHMLFAQQLASTDEMQALLKGPLPSQLWSQVMSDTPPALIPFTAGHHSCQTIVVDKYGNIATGNHTINSLPWGDYGLMVDGVSLNSAYPVAIDAPPGVRALDQLDPVLIFSKGKPIAATGFFSGGLTPASFQIVLNLTDYAMKADAALFAPRFGMVTDVNPMSMLLDARYPVSWLDFFTQSGIHLQQLSGFTDTGMGMIIQIDPATGLRSGSASELLLPYQGAAIAE